MIAALPFLDSQALLPPRHGSGPGKTAALMGMVQVDPLVLPESSFGVPWDLSIVRAAIYGYS
jgi:hypothetical protein